MTEHLPPDVIATLTGMDSAITPELVAATWSLLKPFHDAGATGAHSRESVEFRPIAFFD